jgi:hypothetical protein
MKKILFGMSMTFVAIGFADGVLAASKAPVVIDTAAVLEKAYSLPVVKCERQKIHKQVLGGEKFTSGTYNCEGYNGVYTANIYHLFDGSVEFPKEVVELCLGAGKNKKECKVVYGDTPEGRIENLINFKAIEVADMRDEARRAFLYKEGFSYVESPAVIEMYTSAMSACADQADATTLKTFTWAGRVRSDGKFSFGAVEPKTPFSQCVNEKIISGDFPKPPIAEYDRHGGYPLYFNYPYGEFDGGSTQGLERKEEDKFFIKHTNCQTTSLGTLAMVVCDEDRKTKRGPRVVSN